MKLNRNNKKAKAFKENYLYSNDFSLFHVYKNPSRSKMCAYEDFRAKCVEMRGWGFKILSFNKMSFTCGWLYQDKETGVIMLNVETYRNTYTIEYK